MGGKPADEVQGKDAPNPADIAPPPQGAELKLQNENPGASRAFCIQYPVPSPRSYFSRSSLRAIL
jgi:hypothetical protein